MRRPLVEQGEPLVERAPGLVGDVVGAARERVDGGDVRAQVLPGTSRDATGKFS